MISCIFMGVESSSGVKNIVKAMQGYPIDLLAVFKVNMPDRIFCWAALFKEKNTIGQFVILVNHKGTTTGYAGEGPKAYKHIDSYLDANEIIIIDIEWDELDKGAQKAFLFSDTKAISDFWVTYVNRDLDTWLPNAGDYQVFSSL